MSSAYYNENDPAAAAWLRELIRAGMIAPGVVDTRSITDVQPSDLAGYAQCHFFAGIGGWSYALRLAGWPDHRPVWTGSCPCQPFSQAGRQRGCIDARHLWPAWAELIRQCQPATIFGEQVGGSAGLAWLDHVCADLEDDGYAVAAADLCAAGLGAPHIRQRLYWVAHAAVGRGGCQGSPADHRLTESDGPANWTGGHSGAFGLLAYADGPGFSAGRQGLAAMGYGPPVESNCRVSGVANPECNGHKGGLDHGARQRAETKRLRPADDVTFFGSDPNNSSWRNVDWLGCRDGRWRPVEPGTFPLADGVPARVGRLRCYGNAIVPQVAAAFIEAAAGCL